jgi:hypothetical protein
MALQIDLETLGIPPSPSSVVRPLSDRRTTGRSKSQQSQEPLDELKPERKHENSGATASLEGLWRTAKGPDKSASHSLLVFEPRLLRDGL